MTAQLRGPGGNVEIHDEQDDKLNINPDGSLNIAGTVVVDTSDLAKESTLDGFRSDFQGEDFATQATLELIRSRLASLDGVDFATQATLVNVLAALAAIDASTNELEAKLDTLQARVNLLAEQSTLATIQINTTRTLTERMMARAPQSGWTIWLDTADADHIYILEAVQGSGPDTAGFQGIRITKDVLGNPVGEVEVNTAGTLSFDNRLADGGWS